MIQFDFNEKCYGCGACVEVCPTHAIEMRENSEGFMMPDIDETKCVGCNKCNTVCSRMAPPSGVDLSKSKVYSFFIENQEERVKSTSGGAFYSLAREIISGGGIVCGCVWTPTMEAEIIAAERIEDVEKMRGSKYVQSDIACYGDIRTALRAGKKVLFSGVPCQVAAIQKLFPNEENLYTVALLCENTSSPKAWRKYKETLQDENGALMINAVHRKKGQYGWIAPIAEYEFANGKKLHTLAYTLDEYVHNMIYGYFTRNSCYDCGFKGNSSTADLMIGDFWGLLRKDLFASRNKGCSIVLVNTDKGMELFSKVEGCWYKETTLDAAKVKNPPLSHSVGRNPKRDVVLSALDELPFRKVVTQYCNMNTRKIRIQRIIHKLGLAGLAKIILRT